MGSAGGAIRTRAQVDEILAAGVTAVWTGAEALRDLRSAKERSKP